MNYSAYMIFMLRLYGKAVSVSPHGDNGVLKIASCRSVYKSVKHLSDFFGSRGFISPDAFQLG